MTGKLNGMLKKISLHFTRRFKNQNSLIIKSNIAIHTGKPGMVIGKGGSEIEKLRNKLNNLTDKSTSSKSKN